MIHTISLDAADLAETIKAATNYTAKDVDNRNPLCHLLLKLADKGKNISVIACDGHGYYERKLKIIKTSHKNSLPNKQLCISGTDTSMLAKFIPAKIRGQITLEIDDMPIEKCKLPVKVILPNGASAPFLSDTSIEFPDYDKIKKTAEKNKKKELVLSNINIPVHELIRAGKVFPTKNLGTVQWFTSKSVNSGNMALLESVNDQHDIKVIFMFAKPVDAAA